MIPLFVSLYVYMNMNMHKRMYKQCEKEDEDQKYLSWPLESFYIFVNIMYNFYV